MSLDNILNFLTFIDKYEWLVAIKTTLIEMPTLAEVRGIIPHQDILPLNVTRDNKSELDSAQKVVQPHHVPASIMVGFCSEKTVQIEGSVTSKLQAPEAGNNAKLPQEICAGVKPIRRLEVTRL